MSKILIVVGLVMMGMGISKIARADDVLVTKTHLLLKAGTKNTLMVNLKDEKTQCLLKHDLMESDVVISPKTSFNIQSGKQGTFKTTARERGREILESLGGKYSNSLSNFEMADKIRELGGRFNFVNNISISEFKHVIDLKVQITPNSVLSCRSVEKISYNELVLALNTKSSFDLIELDNQFTANVETQAENNL